MLKKIFQDKEIEAHAFAPNERLLNGRPDLDKKEWNQIITKTLEEYTNSTINRRDKRVYKTLIKNSSKIDKTTLKTELRCASDISYRQNY